MRLDHGQTDAEEVAQELNFETNVPADIGKVVDEKVMDVQVAGECNEDGVLLRKDEQGNIVGTGRNAFITHQPDVCD